MSRTLSIDIDEILSLITCAEDYGFAGDVLFDAFRSTLGGYLTDDEIESFVALTEDDIVAGYGDEDIERQRESLIDFRSQYLKGRKKP